jgi:uncharacterized membrane protein
MSPELKTFLIAVSPIVELRGSIPIALAFYHLPPWSAYLWSVLGNILPLCLIVGTGSFFLKLFSRYVPVLGKIAVLVFEHTRKAHQSKAERWGKNIMVLVLVAIPIPLVGGWTGAIAAFAFGMQLKKAFPFLVLGSMLGGAIVMLFTFGFTAIFLK